MRQLGKGWFFLRYLGGLHKSRKKGELVWSAVRPGDLPRGCVGPHPLPSGVVLLTAVPWILAQCLARALSQNVPVERADGGDR